MPEKLVNRHVIEAQKKEPNMVFHATCYYHDKHWELVDGRIFMTTYADERLRGHPSLPIELPLEAVPSPVVYRLKNGKEMWGDWLIPPNLPISSRLRSVKKRGLEALWHEPLPPRGTRWEDGFLEYQPNPVKTFSACPTSRPYSDFIEPVQQCRPLKRGRVATPAAAPLAELSAPIIPARATPPPSPSWHSSDHESPYEASPQSDSSSPYSPLSQASETSDSPLPTPLSL